MLLYLLEALEFLNELWLGGRRMGGSITRWLSGELVEAAREQGVQLPPRWPHSSKVVGTYEDFSIRIELRVAPGRESEYWIHVCVTVAGTRIPRGLAFALERGSGDDVLTGDSAFDDDVEVRGEPSIVLALLDREIRQRVSEYVRAGGRLEGGRLVCCAPASFVWGEIAQSVRLGLWLARELSSPGGGVCERLARNAKSDPLPGVRLLNLSQLHEQFAETPQAHEASRSDLADPSPWVRLAAARFLKDEGDEVLEHLALDRVAPESAAAEAVALIAARRPAEGAGPLLLTALKTHSGEARRKAVEELGRIRYPAAKGPLVVLLEHADPRTAAAAAAALAALGTVGDFRVEAALLSAAQSDARELRLAAIRSVGTIGSASSVEPLLTFLESRRHDAATRQGIHDAVEGIQSRLAGADAGQLSLAATPPGSGWLSVARPGAADGRLSLISDPQKG